jgi:hypothetical protein
VDELVVVAKPVLGEIDREALAQQRAVDMDAAIALAVRARAAVVGGAFVPPVPAELIRPVACRSALGFEHATRLTMVHLRAILPARAVRIFGAELETNVRMADTRIAVVAPLAILPHPFAVRLRAGVMHDVHCWTADRTVRTHAVIQADQRQAAGAGTRVADRALRAVAVPGAVDAAEIQVHANTPVVEIALIAFITKGEGAALVILAVAFKLVGIRVNHVSGIPTAASPVAPLLALGFFENASILAALPALHAGALPAAPAVAVARALVALGNTGILTTFPAFLTRAFTVFNLILTGTTDDH